MQYIPYCCIAYCIIILH